MRSVRFCDENVYFYSLFNSRDSIRSEKIKGFLKISTLRSLIKKHKEYL